MVRARITSRSTSKSTAKVRAGTQPALSPERVTILQWTARIGAVTAEALADREGVSGASARARLGALERAGWLSRTRPLARQPALYTVTRAGMRGCGLRGLDPCRVSVSSALHLIACAAVAAALERGYPDHRVLGERELRRDERERGVPLGSAQLGIGPGGRALLHRPDLVLWPEGAGDGGRGLPVAVEVELTIKAVRRLTDICRAWARCRCVAGVLYIAPLEVRHALERAIDRAQAHKQIVVVGFDALPSPARAVGGAVAERGERVAHGPIDRGSSNPAEQAPESIVPSDG
jgi:Helix-turn-helix domain